MERCAAQRGYVIGEIESKGSTTARSTIAVGTQYSFTHGLFFIRVIDVLILVNKAMRNKVALITTVLAGQ